MPRTTRRDKSVIIELGEPICAFCHKSNHPPDDHRIGPCGCGRYYYQSCLKKLPNYKGTFRCEYCNKRYIFKSALSYKKILYLVHIGDPCSAQLLDVKACY